MKCIELLKNIEEILNNYVMPIQGKRFSQNLENLKDSITEGLHTLFLMIVDLRKNYDQMDFNLIFCFLRQLERKYDQS